MIINIKSYHKKYFFLKIYKNFIKKLNNKFFNTKKIKRLFKNEFNVFIIFKIKNSKI